MELIERINSLEKEIKVLKGEIKSILVDLRESMNLLENPFASIEHLKAVSGKGARIDEERLRYLEDSVEHLKKMMQDGGKIKELEEEIEQLRSIIEGKEQIGGVDEERIEDLERELEELKEMVEMLRGEEEGEKMTLKEDFDALRRFLEEDLSNRIENLQEGMENLKEMLKLVEALHGSLRSLQEEGEKEGEESALKEDLERMKRFLEEDLSNRLESLHEGLEELKKKLEKQHAEAEGMFEEASPALQASEAAEGASELAYGMLEHEQTGEASREAEEVRSEERAESESGESFVTEMGGVQAWSEQKETKTKEAALKISDVSRKGGERVMDILTISRLIQWADRTVKMIGKDKMLQIIELYGMIGNLSAREKDILLKIAEIPHAFNKEQVETKFCVLALYDLDRILTGRNEEVFTLLKDFF
ncbi:MAG: hypothetical protein MW690_001448 [Methanophagales archaeon]|nr:hypothetical protein [Methanophagales archaeon]MCU4139516.1 hypothetical protein [Methanophagales archaeon]